MGRIGADQARLAGRWLGQQVTADVTRGQSTGTHASEHQVGKVLTNPAPAFQYFHQRSGYLRRFGIESEFAEDFLHQGLDAEQQRPSCRKAALGKLDEVALQMHIRRFEPVTASFKQLRRKRQAAVGQRVAGVFPGWGSIEIDQGPGQHLDREAGIDQQFIMGALERQPGQRVTEHIQLIAT
ncbi:hypothetical protein D9M73_182810 [compost metagenome]